MNLALILSLALIAIVSAQRQLPRALKNKRPRLRVVPESATKLKGRPLTDYINRNQKWFTVRSANISTETKQHRVFAGKFIVKSRAVTPARDGPVVGIPYSFDSRTQWPHCASMRTIGNQANCGSCWAWAAASAMSDRFCAASNGTYSPQLSAEDILACTGGGNSCWGGYLINAWRYMARYGVVTGGQYGDKNTCKPYSMAPCSGSNYYCPVLVATPTCQPYCQRSYGRQYYADKYYAANAYDVARDVTSIQLEIMANGPVEASFTVYDDFNYYRSGVYVHTAGAYIGGHAIKIIGWGRSGYTDYWLVSNSWGTSWGEQGYFRIARGINECGIESNVVAGIPHI